MSWQISYQNIPNRPQFGSWLVTTITITLCRRKEWRHKKDCILSNPSLAGWSAGEQKQRKETKTKTRCESWHTPQTTYFLRNISSPPLNHHCSRHQILMNFGSWRQLVSFLLRKLRMMIKHRTFQKYNYPGKWKISISLALEKLRY